ncbi:MAG: thioredoxin domain-containing protein [Thermoanaerobaculia bacterium]|nr:thioredoxin domain-containing protein [Thermoanaerobaculia bacterium]
MTDNDTKTTGGRRTLLLLITGVLLVAFGWILSGETLEATSDTQPAAVSVPETVAQIDGQEISLADLEKAAAEPLDQLEMQRLQMDLKMKQERQKILIKELDQLVEDRLLEKEAGARGVSVDELVAAEISPAEVTDEDIDAFYADLQTQRQGVPPLERIGEQIRTHLTQAKAQEAREDFLDNLRDKYKVDVFLSEPRVEIATDGHPTLGPDTAPVTIVAFSDFECPYCERVVPTIEQVRKNYGDQVRVVFRQFPLSIHANAQKAAEASLCAGDQGKFWEMHDLMFAEQKQLGVEALKDKAARLELDGAQFAKCLDSGQHEDQVKADVREGFKIGVSSTPSLFINGQALTGAQPYPTIAAIIDAELKKAGSGKS